MPDIFILRDWQSFYMLTGTASATLIGLIFIAISFGARLARSQSESSVRAFLTPTVIHFGLVLSLSILAIIPTYTMQWLAIMLISVGAIGVIYAFGILRQLLTLLRHAQKALDAHHWSWHLYFPLLSYLMIFATGVGLLFGLLWPLNLMALAVTTLIIVGLRNAFDLMMWIARQPD